MTEANGEVGTGSGLAATLAEYGLLAASAHNTQPWLVSIDSDRLRIFPDRSRQLGADPTGRELFLALGCFWGNVRLAARSLGVQIKETASGEQVEIIVDGAEGVRDEATLSAIRTRRNNRFPLTGPLDESLLTGGGADGLEVCVITDPGRKGAVADIARDAFAASTKDPRFRAELAQWVRSNTTSAKDGMPGYAMGVPTLLSYLLPILVRLPTPPSLARQERDRTNSAPAVVAICGDDRQEEWVKAGRVFQEMAVRLEMDGVTTAMNASAIETAGFPEKLRDAVGATKRPLMLFRAGRATRTSRAVPRRELVDILQRR